MMADNKEQRVREVLFSVSAAVGFRTVPTENKTSRTLFVLYYQPS
jgi:hypothetical protein